MAQRPVDIDRVNGPFGTITGKGRRWRTCVAAKEPPSKRAVREIRQQAHVEAWKDSRRPVNLRWRSFIALICAHGVSPTPADYREASYGENWWSDDHWMDADGLWWTRAGLPISTKGRVLAMAGDMDVKPKTNSKARPGLSDPSQVFNLDEKKIRYAEWEMTRKEERTQTKAELAKELGVSLSVLYKWSHEPAVMAKMKELTRKRLTRPQTQIQMLWAIEDNLADGDMMAVDRLLKWLAIADPQKPVTSMDLDEAISGMSADEIVESIKQEVADIEGLMYDRPA